MVQFEAYELVFFFFLFFLGVGGEKVEKCMDKILEIIYIYIYIFGERDILEITSKLYMILSIYT